MEYELMLRSCPVAGESIQAKHETFRAAASLDTMLLAVPGTCSGMYIC